LKAGELKVDENGTSFGYLIASWEGIIQNRTIASAFILLTIFFFTACSPAEPVQNPSAGSTSAAPAQVERIDVCHQITSSSNLPILYAQEKGLFKKYGLEVTLTSVDTGTKAATAMIAGEFPFCQVGGVSITNAVVAGEDLVYIADYFNSYVLSLMVTQDIKTAADLKGKIVVTSEPGSVIDSAMRAALMSFNLVPEVDVAFINVSGASNRMAALEAGRASGSLFSPPLTLTLREKGYETLLDLTTLDQAFPYYGIATSRTYMNTNRETVLNFMKAITESIAGILSDPEGSKSILAEHLEMDEVVDAALLEEAYQAHYFNIIRKKPYPTIEGIQTVLNQIGEENPNAENTQPEDVIDVSIITELDKSGFIDALYESQ